MHLVIDKLSTFVIKLRSVCGQPCMDDPAFISEISEEY